MVNYSRMEDVWRSYGPIEPVGDEGRPRRRAAGVAVFGLATVVGAGAVLGLYLRPEGDSRERARSEPAAQVAAAEPEPQLAAEVTEPVEEPQVLASAATAAAGGALPADTVPPYSAPPAPVLERASVPASAPRIMVVRPQAPAIPAAAPAPPRAAVTAQRPAPRTMTVAANTPRPEIVRTQPAPVVEPRVAPAPERPIVLARREDAPTLTPVPRVRATTPSFDCGGVQGAGAKVVCADPRLARLDRIMAAEYAAAVAAAMTRRGCGWTRTAGSPGGRPQRPIPTRWPTSTSAGFRSSAPCGDGAPSARFRLKPSVGSTAYRGGDRLRGPHRGFS
jgi:hypothetical protein